MNRKKILIVDDNEVILKTLALKLKAADYEVLTAKEGAEAVSAVRVKKPDLILLDINLPTDVTGVPWDGFRIIQWLRRMDEAKTTPIVIITGGEAAKFKDRALTEGAVAFFQKPINPDDLLAELVRLIGASAPVPAATAK